MQRSSPSIGTLAAALAKAQGELVNPEKSLVAPSAGMDQRDGPDVSLCAVVERSRYCAQGSWAARDCHGADDRDRSG